MNFNDFNLSFNGFNFVEKSFLNNEFGNNALLERGLLLYTFAKIAKAKTIIETGTANGFSSICLAKAIQDNNLKGEIHTFDLYSWGNEFSSEENAKRSTQLNKATDIITRHIGNSLEFLPKVLKQLTTKVDFAHIDSEHDYNTPKKEFELIEPYLNDNAYIFFHDTDINDVKNAVKDILQARQGQYEKITVPLHSEMTVLRKINKDSNDE